jgi:hypothetical protein
VQACNLLKSAGWEIQMSKKSKNAKNAKNAKKCENALMTVSDKRTTAALHRPALI